MSGVDPKRFHELTLTCGAGRDVLLFALPTYPDIIHLWRARVSASGWTDEDREEKRAEPSGVLNTDDGMGVFWAAVGLCWTGDRLATRFRDTNPPRDVVAYGEAVVTELRGLGFDPAELATAGSGLCDWLFEVTFGIAEEPGAMQKIKSEATFTDPPTEQATVGEL